MVAPEAARAAQLLPDDVRPVEPLRSQGPGAGSEIFSALDTRYLYYYGITTALENGYSLEDVQCAAGHREPGTTNLYDRRGYNPEKSASFFATY